MVGHSLQTLIQLLSLPPSFRTSSGHAFAVPLGIERPSYLAEDLVSQASNAGPSSHTLRWGWARRGTCIVHFHTLLSEELQESLAFGRKVGKERDAPNVRREMGRAVIRDGAIMANIEGGGWREGSKMGPEARQKASRLQAVLRNTSLFLNFCPLFQCLQWDIAGSS